MVVEQNLSDERAAGVSQEHERKLGILGADDLGQLPDRGDGRPKPARARASELGARRAVLGHAGAAVAAVIVRVHGEAVGGERVEEGAVRPACSPRPWTSWTTARGVVFAGWTS